MGKRHTRRNRRKLPGAVRARTRAERKQRTARAVEQCSRMIARELHIDFDGSLFELSVLRIQTWINAARELLNKRQHAMSDAAKQRLRRALSKVREDAELVNAARRLLAEDDLDRLKRIVEEGFASSLNSNNFGAPRFGKVATAKDVAAKLRTQGHDARVVDSGTISISQKVQLHRPASYITFNLDDVEPP